MAEAATTQSSDGSQTQSGSATTASAAGSQSTQASTTQQTATILSRPEWAPDGTWDEKTGLNLDAFNKHYADKLAPVLTRDAAEQVRRNALPQKAEEYKLDLPADFKLPQGVEFKLDPAKPEFAKFQTIAHKRGLDQDTVTELMGAYAETLVGGEAQIAAARAKEVEKLGANATARVTALNTFFTGTLGADDAKALNSMMVTAGIVTAFEKLVAKFASQGAASFRSDGRVPHEQGGRVDQATYDKMSQAEKWNYSRSFDQKQFQQKAN